MFTYGIDANVLTRDKITGTERYVLSLLKEMMNFPLKSDERVLLYSSAPLPQLGTLPDSWRVEILNWVPRKAWTHGRLSWELVRRPPNVFFSPAHEIPLFFSRTKIVSTIHDIAFKKYPEVYSSKNYKRHEWAIGRVIKLADRIITVSETTKNDIIRYYQVPIRKLTATPLAVNKHRFQVSADQIDRVLQRYNLKKHDYFISVGRIEKKKNILTLIKAFEPIKEHQLVLGGFYGHGEDEIKNEISKIQNIRVLGYVPDDDLPALIAGAIAYVFPSRYEGFGIPALEAMAAGTALIASDIPALHEVAGKAALFVSATDTFGWTRAMRELSGDVKLREYFISLGRENLDDFSWHSTAEKTWQVLRSLK